MANQKLKIGCPVCGSVLVVLSQPNIERKNVTCPICKNRSPFIKFKEIEGFSIIDEERKKHPEEEITQYPSDDTTMPHHTPNYTIGQLIVPALNLKYQLLPGKNVIGRGFDHTKSQADFRIPYATKRTSRHHITINVRKVDDKGFVHLLSTYKSGINPTFLNDTQLEYGDSVILKSGDIIKLPDGEARFEIPDDECTEF